MALEHLLATLERDTAAQVDHLLADARAAAAAVAREADEHVTRRRRESLGAHEAGLRVAAETTLAEARRAARQRVLDARRRFLERVFAAARALLPEAVAGAPYRAALPRHVRDALAAVGDEPSVIRCPPTLAPAVRASLPEKQHLVVQGDASAPPGIAVMTADRLVEVDQTLDGRLERMRARLSLEVLARLDAPR